ncbi:MAG TPA: hypothetical protein VFN21_08335 [Acidimicrobiales bacterium]|nr:hypothetical protein [Acidimicrobiales bacterium]
MRVKRDLSVVDVLAPAPSMWRMVARALVLRCPRCGAGGQFRHWIRRVDHCPGCGYTLDRDHDSFFGAYLLNLCVCFASLFGLLIACVIFEAARNPLPMGPVIGVGLFFAIGLPVLFYPFSYTLWAVADLRSDPLRLDEIVDAVDKIETDGAGDDDKSPCTTGPGKTAG